MNKLLFLTALFSTTLLYSFGYQKNGGKGPVPGDQVTYTYAVESMGYSDIKSLFTPDTNRVKKAFFTKPSLKKTEAHINCKVTVTVTRVFSGSVALVFQLSGLDITIINNGSFINTEVFKKEMCRPVFAMRANNGKIGTIRADSSISLFSASMVKEIISRLQFVKSSANAKEWSAKEVNSTGGYLADYHSVGSKKGLLKFEKINKGYINNLPAHSRREQLVTGGQSVIQTDKGYLIQQENTSETLTVLVGGDTVSMSGTQINIKRTRAAKADAKALYSFNRLLALARYKKVSTLSAKLTDDEIGKLAYTNTLGKDNLASLMQKLSRLNSADMDAKEDLIMKFRALASMYPAACKNIGLLLEKEPYGTLTFEILGKALSRTKTSTATDVLAELITVRRNEREILIDFLPVLATTTHPTVNAVAAVKSLGFNNDRDAGITMMAQMTLGGIAHNFAAVNARQSDAICSFLLNRMKAEPDTVQKLLVLGNTGSPLIMPLLKSYLNNPVASAKVRAYALKAMRMVPTAEATSVLKNMMASKDSLLLTATMETLKFREQYAANQSGR